MGVFGGSDKKKIWVIEESNRYKEVIKKYRERT